MSESFPSLIIVMALRSEGGGLFERDGIPVLYTGVGKVNAAYVLTRALAEVAGAAGPLPLVINFGTAGSNSLPVGGLIACSAFVQRDMDASALGFAPGTTPFDVAPALIEFPSVFPELPHAVCGTGDSFSTLQQGSGYDLVDMEAYALAKVCSFFGARFGCIKYITDGADATAGAAWEENLHKAAEHFIARHAELIGKRA